MSAPEPYNRQTSFALFTAENPGVAHSGVDLDTEFNAVKISLDETQANLVLIQRADGRLQNGSVGRDQLDSSITIGFESPTPWATATDYTGDTSTVFHLGVFYTAQESHTSGVFATDLAAGKWLLVADLSVATALADGAVTTVKLADFAVTNDKLGNGSVGSTKLATNAVTTTKITDASVTTAKIADSNITTAKIADSNVTTAKVANDAITYAKIQNVSATSRLLGRTTALAGDIEEITLAGKVEFVGNTVTGKLPRSYLAGCGASNNATDATNDLDIAAGECRDSTNAVNITVAAMTKQLDANWAPGTNAGLRNSASAIADGTYHVYAVSKADDTQDFYAVAGVAGTDPDSGASVAATIAALQLESGGGAYLYARRVLSIVRESAAIVPFTQTGDRFTRTTIAATIADNNPGSGAAVTSTLPVPLGLNVEARLNVNILNQSVTLVYGLLSEIAAADQAPTSALYNFGGVSNVAGQSKISAGQYRLRTNTSGQVRYRLNASSTDVTVNLQTTGWTDRRGRDA